MDFHPLFFAGGWYTFCLMPMWEWIIAVLAAYVCGSTPFGLLIGKANGIDLRKVGSGNIGATNCGRVLGQRWGMTCFFLDLLKGFVPVFLAGWWFGWIGPEAEISSSRQWSWLAVAVAAVLGHVFPFWLKFKGGKGVATGLGAVLGVWPALTIPAICSALTWAIIVKACRYVGLASVVASILLPIFAAIAAKMLGRSMAEVAPYLIVTGAMAILILFRHWGNLQRTFAGTEPKLGEPAGEKVDSQMSKK